MSIAAKRQGKQLPETRSRGMCDYCERKANLIEFSPKTSVWAVQYFGALCPGCFVKQTAACRVAVKQLNPGLFELLRQEEEKPS